MATGIAGLLREVRGSRQKQEAAEELGVTPSTYGRWENGQTAFPPERLPWLAEMSGVTLADVESMWKLDSGSRAMRRATADDVNAFGVLRDVAARQEQIAEILGTLVERIERLEGAKPRRRATPTGRASAPKR